MYQSLHPYNPTIGEELVPYKEFTVKKYFYKLIYWTNNCVYGEDIKKLATHMNNIFSAGKFFGESTMLDTDNKARKVPV